MLTYVWRAQRIGITKIGYAIFNNPEVVILKIMALGTACIGIVVVALQMQMVILFSGITIVFTVQGIGELIHLIPKRVWTK